MSSPSPTDQLHWLLTLVSTLSQSKFYGEVTISFQDGQVTVAKMGQTLKPSCRKSFKQMTAAEYQSYQTAMRLLGDLPNGQEAAKG